MIPGLKEAFDSNQATGFHSLADIFNGLANIVFFIAGFLMLFWFSWGVFQYIFSGGSKDGLAKARSRMTWAVVGFFITALAFAISQFASQIFPNINPAVTPVSLPVGKP